MRCGTGDGTTRRLAKMRFNFRTLGTLFITHGHNDHTGGLGMVLSSAWTAQRTVPINVYGPPGTAALVKETIGYFGLDAEIRISDSSRHIAPGLGQRRERVIDIAQPLAMFGGYGNGIAQPKTRCLQPARFAAATLALVGQQDHSFAGFAQPFGEG